MLAYLLQHKYLPMQQEGKVCSWKVYFQVVPHRDEARFGLMTVQRRVLTMRGIKPIGAFQQRFIFRYVYGVVSPCDGDHFYITDFYGLDKHWRIIFFIFCTSIYYSKNTFDQFVSNSV